MKNKVKNAGILFDDILWEKPTPHGDMRCGFTPHEKMQIFFSNFLSNVMKNNSKNAGVLFNNISQGKPAPHSDMRRRFTPL